MTPRAYQIDCLDAVKLARDEGVTRQLIVLPTGSGKAFLAASMPTTLGLAKNRRSLTLVHRDELAFQMAEKMHRCNPGLRVGIEKANLRAEDADLVVASVQTIGRANATEIDGECSWEYSPRIKQFNPDHFEIVQCDESHHLSVKAKQWSAILRYMRVLKGDEHEDKSKILQGFTATPSRADGLGLEAFFQKIVFNYDLLDAIKDKWLADVVCYRVETEIDISKVKTSMGDLNVGDLSETVNTPERNELVARKYKEISNGLPSLFFTVDIQHSIDIAETLCRHGFRVYPLSEKTPDGERRKLMRLMREGQINGLSSCGILSEGTDIPNAEVAYMLRPTKSELLYRQQVGRVLRPSPSPEDMETYRRSGILYKGRIKPNAIVVDFCDISGRHSLISVPTLFGLRANFDTKGKKLLDTVQEIEQLELANPGVNLRGEPNIDHIKACLRNINLLAPPMMPPEIRQYSKFTWLSDGAGSYRIGLTDGTMLSIRENTLGRFDISRHMKGVKTPIAESRTLREAIAESESHIPQEEHKLLNATAGWRKEGPSEKQAHFLYWKDKKVGGAFPNKDAFYQYCLNRFKTGDTSFSKGELSRRIDSLRTAG